MKTNGNRDKRKKKNPQAVRNQRVIIFTFVIVLALMFRSNHWSLEKERLSEAIRTSLGQETVEGEEVEGDSAVPLEETATEDEILAKGETLIEGETSPEGVPTAEKVSDSLVIREEDLWCLILTNARYPVPDDYEVELAQVPGSNQSVDARIYEPLMAMFEAMKEEGLHPVVCSGYRTLDKQEKLFNRKVQTYVRNGYSMEEANGMARQVLSIPGSGEHCLGLAVDIFASSYRKLETGFEKTPEGTWLREHSQDYGFTLRYERGKEEVTGIQYEPWHFRYVGVEAARYLKEHQLSLEEFYIEQSLYG